MNKSKKQLFEENQKYKEMFENYREFWEYDMSKKLLKQLITARNAIFTIAIVLLCLACFIFGLTW